MKKMTQSQKAPLNSKDLSEDEIEDVLFGFLDRLNKSVVVEKRRKKFLELLVRLGPEDAEMFMGAIASDLDENTNARTSSPSVGEVIHKFLQLKNIGPDDLAADLGIDAAHMGQLLIESYRVVDYGFKEIALTIAKRYQIPKELAFRNILASGYAFWCMQPSASVTTRIAARRKKQ